MNPSAPPPPSLEAAIVGRASGFDLLVFDWDGTLFDSTALIVQCIQAACCDIGILVPDARRAAYVIGLSLQSSLRQVAPGLTPDQYGLLVDRYRYHYFARQHVLTLFPGVLELLRSLRERRHFRLAVATGKSRAGLDDALATSELRGLFDATRTADETRSKPHPQMLQELMRQLGVEPERTLMIGDTTHDLQLAANAGTHSLAVSYGAHGHDDFAAYAPTFVAHSVRELSQWLSAHA